MQDILASVDFQDIVSWVIAIGVLILGVAMAFKGIDLSKRAISYLDGNPIKEEDRPENWDEDDWQRNYAEGYERSLRERD